MTTTQLYFALAIPSIFGLIGIATNITLYVFLAGRTDRSWDSLRTEMRADRKELGEKIDKLREDMFTHFNEFFKTLAHHDAQIEAIKEKHK